MMFMFLISSFLVVVLFVIIYLLVALLFHSRCYIESDLFAVAERRPPSPALSPDAKEWSPAAAMFVSVEAVIGNQICEGELQKVDRGTIFADVLQCTRAAAKEGLSHISQQVKVKIKKSLTKRSVNVAELSWRRP